MEKIGTLAKLSAPPPATGVPPRPYHWTVDSFYRAIDAAAFGLWPRVELVRGEIIEHDGQTPLHAAVADLIAEHLRCVLPRNCHIREHKPLNISEDTEPDVDVSVVMGGIGTYRERHPSPPDALFLIEVSDTSADYDLGKKAQLYAQAGITDYWVVLPNENVIVVHREPTPDGYGQITSLGEDDSVTPLGASEVSLSVRSLLGR